MAAPPIYLIPLVCAQCKAPIPAQPGEVAWACSTCGGGSLLTSSGQVTPLPILYAPEIPSGAKGRPFWVAEGQVTIRQRETFRGNEARAAAEFWAAPRRFFIPAYAAALDEVIAAGVKLLRQGVNTRPTAQNSAPFLPVTTPPEDMPPLAEFIVLAVEADRRDALKTVHFTVQLTPPELWVLP